MTRDGQLVSLGVLPRLCSFVRGVEWLIFGDSAYVCDVDMLRLTEPMTM